MSKRILLLVAIGIALAAFVAWKVLAGPDLPEGIAAGNGRLEANELFISAKIPGRIKEVLVNEGDTVQPGQIVARLDTEELEAGLRQAVAQMNEARQAELVTRADINTKRAQIASRQADISAKQADYVYAAKQATRSRGLVSTGAVSEQESEVDTSKAHSTQALVAGSRADLAAARADLVGSQALAGRSGSTIVAAAAEADRIRAQI